MSSITHFKALADETRLRLLNIFLHHELNVNEIVKVMEMAQPRISRHLKILADSGLIIFRRDGLWTFYSITTNSNGARFVDAVKYIFEQDGIFKKDLDRAQRIVDERARETLVFFDSIAEDWQDLKREIIGDFDLNKKILGLVPTVDVAVDLGCGTGDFLHLLAQKADRVIGVDKSPGMLEQTRQRFAQKKEKIDVRIGELEHLPMKDEEADLGVLNMVLHHMHTPLAALVEIDRVLKPGGKLIIVDLLSHSLEMMRDRFGDHWLGFDLDQVEDWLTQVGFVIEKPEHLYLKKDLTGFISISRKNIKKGE